VGLATPDRIRRLQKKLYVKAKGEPHFRFYLLYDKVWRADILEHAYRLCRAKKGAPGVDEVTFEDIESGDTEARWRRASPGHPHDTGPSGPASRQARHRAHLRG